MEAEAEDLIDQVGAILAEDEDVKMEWAISAF